MKVTGKAKYVSKQFIRCWIEATLSVLRLHNLPLEGEWRVKIVDLSERWNHVSEQKGCGGVCFRSTREIHLSWALFSEAMATTIVHEFIHAVLAFPDGTEEKCTSTLTEKLKPCIQPIAQRHLDDYYRVAAFIAHTKPGMSYSVKEGEEDYYDNGQWIQVGVVDHRKYAWKKKFGVKT